MHTELEQAVFMQRQGRATTHMIDSRIVFDGVVICHQHDQLTVGDPEDPYANVDQNVKGKINSKTGVVSLSGSGATKSTSKVKITLNYVNATGDTIDGKSSVNAYAQKRKF